MNCKILGLVGGIGPESTVDYYKSIIRKFRERFATNDYPHFLINTINMTKMLCYVKENRLGALTDFLAKEIKQLEDAGADFGAMASNTPHIVFDELEAKVSLPLISIVKETVKDIRKQGLKKVALFGTMSTMDGGFYQKAGSDASIEIVTPDNASKEYINRIYFGELVLGIMKEETKRDLIAVVRTMKEHQGIEGLVLGGTELPLILHQDDFKDIMLFNTSQIHVDSIIEMMNK